MFIIIIIIVVVVFKVPDVFPLLRYAELNPNRIRIAQRSSSTGHQEEEGGEEEERERRPLDDIDEDPRERSFSDSMRTPPTQPPCKRRGCSNDRKKQKDYCPYFNDRLF